MSQLIYVASAYLCSTSLGLAVYSAQMNKRSANGMIEANKVNECKSFSSQPQKEVNVEAVDTGTEKSFFKHNQGKTYYMRDLEIQNIIISASTAWA